MRIVITGVKGSGKTTTARLVQAKIPEVKVFSYGDYFVDLVRKKCWFPEEEQAKRDFRDNLDKMVSRNGVLRN